jgi:hypothetical protein
LNLNCIQTAATCYCAGARSSASPLPCFDAGRMPPTRATHALRGRATTGDTTRPTTMPAPRPSPTPHRRVAPPVGRPPFPAMSLIKGAPSPPRPLATFCLSPPVLPCERPPERSVAPLLSSPASCSLRPTGLPPPCHSSPPQ